MIGSVVGTGAFRVLRTEGRRVTHGPIRVRFVPAEQAEPRLAFAIGRRFGNAVERNRARRRLRPAFEQAFERNQAPIGDVLVSCSRSVLTLTHSELAVHVDGVVRRLEGRRT